MLYATTGAMTTGAIKRFDDGTVRVPVLCRDGQTAYVPAHRLDAAQWIAAGAPRPTQRTQATSAIAKAAPGPAKGATSCGFTLTQVHALASLLTPLADRLKALEQRKESSTTQAASSTCREVALARIAVARARAAVALAR